MRIAGMKRTKLYRHLRRIRTAASRDAVFASNFPLNVPLAAQLITA